MKPARQAKPATTFIICCLRAQLHCLRFMVRSRKLARREHRWPSCALASCPQWDVAWGSCLVTNACGGRQAAPGVDPLCAPSSFCCITRGPLRHSAPTAVCPPFSEQQQPFDMPPPGGANAPSHDCRSCSHVNAHQHYPDRPSCLPCAAEVEGQYLADVAKRRWPVLIFVFCFDVGCYLLRLGAKLLANHPKVTPVGLIQSLLPQLANMACCYAFLSYVNRRSRRMGDRAARQVPARSPLAHVILAARKQCKHLQACLCAGESRESPYGFFPLLAAPTMQLRTLDKGPYKRAGGVYAGGRDGARDHQPPCGATAGQRAGLRPSSLFPDLHHLLLEDPLVHRHLNAGESPSPCLRPTVMISMFDCCR